MSEDLAKRRFLVLQAIRFTGVALAFFGAAVTAGKTILPPVSGYVFLGFGTIDALILPVVVTRMWKSKGQ